MPSENTSTRAAEKLKSLKDHHFSTRMLRIPGDWPLRAVISRDGGCVNSSLSHLSRSSSSLKRTTSSWSLAPTKLDVKKLTVPGGVLALGAMPSPSGLDSAVYTPAASVEVKSRAQWKERQVMSYVTGPVQPRGKLVPTAISRYDLRVE